MARRSSNDPYFLVDVLPGGLFEAGIEEHVEEGVPQVEAASEAVHDEVQAEWKLKCQDFDFFVLLFYEYESYSYKDHAASFLYKRIFWYRVVNSK